MVVAEIAGVVNVSPAPNCVPPVGASNQVNVVPPFAVAARLAVPPAQIDCAPAVTVGFG